MSNVLEDQRALEALVVNNPELEQLEALLDEFNIFEALGAVRAELRHSDFLAFLLDPHQNHGLGDAFTKAFLQNALVAVENAPISPIDLDIWGLDEVRALREWRAIDILLVDERNRLVVLIENKIDSAERSNQLQRYYHTVEQHFPDSRIVAFFLTPEGDEPSDERYIPISYKIVADVAQRMVERRASTLGPDIRTLLLHYVKMLRRYIVKESEIVELCQKIYRKHQRALDLIYEYRPDLQQDIRSLVEAVIQERSDLKLAHSTKTYIRFLPREWDVPGLKGGSEWVPQGHILLFEFVNGADSLKLKLTIGPGRPGFTRRLFELAQQKAGTPLTTFYKRPNSKWNSIYLRNILTRSDYSDAALDSLEPKIRKKWKEFLEQDLPAIQAVLRNQPWFGEMPTTGE